ncbi:MAG TPA: VIT1/CCC1 transporter family protein [Thermoplasmata archaeon]|nr:VIT1/CCC1 transporter family protein [Thermoplasmata archaeon]
MASRIMFWRREQQDAQSLEQHPKPGLLSDFILGSQDGLVNVLGVIIGVAVAALAQPGIEPLRIVVAGGLAATFAESISMGAVAYTSTLARRDHYLSEQERERKEMVDLPDLEREEVRIVFEKWGFRGKDLEDLTDKIVSNPTAWLEFMMAHELNLAPIDKTQARQSAVLVGFAAIIGSLVPLAPFVLIPLTGWSIFVGIVASLIVSAATLFLIGWYKGRATLGRPARSGLQMLVIGIVSAFAGFGIAYLVGAVH